jgi:hypothetical protein
MKLVEVIRKTQKEYRTSMNKIEAVMLVRKLTGRGLKEAKDFFDWMDANGDGLSAPRLAGHWCVEHWQDNESCGCPEGVEVVADEPKPRDKPAAATLGSLTSRPETCGFMTTMGVCGHPLVDGKCRFIYHNKEQRQ